MTLAIGLVLAILLVALVLFVTEWIRMDLVALLVLSALALSGAAAASFASPVAHPANVLVMGPGGYRFADYLRVGLPLTLVVFVLAFALMPFVWPI